MFAFRPGRQHLNWVALLAVPLLLAFVIGSPIPHPPLSPGASSSAKPQVGQLAEVAATGSWLAWGAGLATQVRRHRRGARRWDQAQRRRRGQLTRPMTDSCRADCITGVTAPSVRVLAGLPRPRGRRGRPEGREANCYQTRADDAILEHSDRGRTLRRLAIGVNPSSAKGGLPIETPRASFKALPWA